MQQQKKGENGTQKGIKADRKKKGWWGGEGSSKWERREGRGKWMGGKKQRRRWTRDRVEKVGRKGGGEDTDSSGQYR